MAIQKKSLIGNLTAAKKAIIATNVASTPFAMPSKVETGKQTAHVAVAKHAAKPVGMAVAKAFAKTAAKTAAKTTAKTF